MGNNITLGKYIPNDTFFHRLDPRCKIILLFSFMITIFIQLGIVGYIVLGLVTLVCFILSKIKIITIIKSLKPMWFMVVFIFIVNLLVVKDGTPWRIWKITIYSEAVFSTLRVAYRLILLISTSTIFTATTKPLDITIAIEDLFGFLKKVVNVHILSMVISIALRFIPTILDETYRIMRAQASRGVDFVHGKLKEKAVAITSLIIPLFISAFSRSADLADAMEARSYNPYAKRTRYRKLKWHFKDTIMLFLTLGLMIAFIVLSALKVPLDSILLGWLI
ncbi:putative uncharacterized protein [Firmicutes bacterium CAG:631]|jgi:hypothetical protein|nr:putative uncharacterized protein [Firmicutes bacterium CAG:631]